ncbi:MAG TPA: tripartite tricarboxylate transporter substrate-binding protein, partial [Burkholderiaceae bacterium]|nr:tripartite tricarboxylate transporter substrate-binding protein [Burkholderiaceae bacterium]
PGAGPAIAAEAVARAQPDGYTLSLASAGQLTVLPLLHEKLNFDPVKSFAPVALAAEVPYIVSVGPGTSAATLSELLEQARSSSEGFNYSSCGNGTVCHLTGELLNTLADAKLQHVPFSGSAPAITAVLGGHVQVAVDTAAVQAPHIRSGKLRPLVITSEKRSPALPEVPSAAEVGLPSFVSSSWFGVVVPAGTPEPIIARLNAEIGKALESERTRERFSTLGLSALGGTPEQLADLVQADLQKWKTVVDRAGVKAH